MGKGTNYRMKKKFNKFLIWYRTYYPKLYTELKKLDITKNPVVQLKMGTDLNGEFPVEVTKMLRNTLVMLKICSHQRNANEGNSEIPSYTCQND